MSTQQEREQFLAERTRAFVNEGWRVESQNDYSVTFVKGRRPNHLLHLILTLITVGLWGVLVWLPLVLFGGEKRQVVTLPSD